MTGMMTDMMTGTKRNADLLVEYVLLMLKIKEIEGMAE